MTTDHYDVIIIGTGAGGGTLAHRLHRSHSDMDDADYSIAGNAMVLEADLLTTNVRHFPMIKGLQPPY